MRNFVNGVDYKYMQETGEVARDLDEMPFDKVFPVNGNEELCHATGREVYQDGQWWNEYEDSEGELHYGR